MNITRGNKAEYKQARVATSQLKLRENVTEIRWGWPCSFWLGKRHRQTTSAETTAHDHLTYTQGNIGIHQIS